MEDINSEDKAEIYGSKYVKVDDGNYFVDLSSGKVSDDKIEENALDTVLVALRNKIKSDNDGRIDETDAKDIKDITALPEAKFSDVWYGAKYIAKDSNTDGGAAL